MKKPTLITYIPKLGTRDFHGPARSISVKPRKAWRKQVWSFLATTPCCESALIEFSNDTWQIIHR
jgi:hypothetical protein